ncbi:MAG TPA: alkaline phosphatase family protein [Solirubrobacterales bacterium]|nr:alkaline phosphatase family protein [Solirubrobacterales bacterium]
MAALRRQMDRAVAAAATLTGKRFGLLVASSLVATSAIVAAALTAPGHNGALAALLGRSLAAERTPVQAPATEPSGAEEPFEPSPSPAPSAASSQAAQPSPPPKEAAPGPSPQGQPEEAPPPPSAVPAPEAGRVKHVFVLSLASPGYEAAFGPSSQMPYLASLRPQGELLSNYSLLSASGLPNSFAAISGQPPTPAAKAGCPDYGRCVFPAEVLTLADQLGLARFTWRAYVEGMADPTTGAPANCVYPQPGAPESSTPGSYSARSNPFVYFHSLLDLGDCAASDLPASKLEADLSKASATPNFSYIAPSLCNAGVPDQCPPPAEGASPVEGAAATDAYLAQLVPKILASPAYKKDGVLILAFSEAPPPAAGAPAPTEPLKTGALLVSPFLTPGATDSAEYSPYSLLKTTEDLFGLSYLEKAKGLKVRSFSAALLGTNGGD